MIDGAENNRPVDRPIQVGGNNGQAINPGVVQNVNPEVDNRQNIGGLAGQNAWSVGSIMSRVGQALNLVGDGQIREREYTMPLREMPDNVEVIAEHMNSHNYHEALVDSYGAHGGDADSLAHEVGNLSTQDLDTAELKAFEKFKSVGPGGREYENVELSKAEINGEIEADKKDYIKGQIAEMTPEQTKVFEMLFTQEVEITAIEKSLPETDVADVKTGASLATWEYMAESACEQRNYQMGETRKQISDLGLLISEFMKKDGLTFEGLLEKTAHKAYGAEQHFDALSNEQKIDVYREIIASASRSNPNLLDKFMGTIATQLGLRAH